MNGFNCIALGEDLAGYSQYDRDSLPAYWAYADRFVIADHFFTSMYGPTFPEHLYTVAAQTNGVVDNKSTTNVEGNYCDDPHEYTKRFPLEDLTEADIKRIMRLEENITASPQQLFEIAQYWESTRTCFNIKVLPDLLEHEGISWKYYALPDKWMNALQAIRHVRFGPMWKKVQDPGDDPAGPEAGHAAGGVVADPAGGQPERAPGLGHERLRRRELDRGVRERDPAERVLAEHGDRDRVGRLRRLLRSRAAAALRHHGPRSADAGADHLARTRAAATTPTAARSTARSTSSPRCCGSSRSCTG